MHAGTTDHARTEVLALDFLAHDAALAMLGALDPARHGAAFLDVVHRLSLGRQDLAALELRVVRDLLLGDVDCATRQQGSTRSGCGQFRQGQFYRHGQALLLRSGRQVGSGSAPKTLPCRINKRPTA
ncbi:hypothetical protein [Parerythrobacter lacustris]|uniref:Uncharacterized protein n=1 Tax=Parerythrobacter lacustris TaxID=2969984 RepID=A0ABT1XM08_9SPHN|nr:hypothetical protein [Parerythrobacter lacustris]MCR2832688.1 hypothetical protein [Parerythrobacter lacustris]